MNNTKVNVDELRREVAACHKGASMSTTETKVRHTATPWRVMASTYANSKEIHSYDICQVVSPDWPEDKPCRSVATIEFASGVDAEDAANAEFIVRAVNSHADMLEALEQSMELLRLIRDKMPLAWESVIDLKPGTNSPSFLVDVWDANKAAIAKAKGGA